MRDRGGMLLGLRAAQLALLGIGGIAVLLGLLAAGGQGGLVGGGIAVVMAFVALFPVQGRALVDWAGPLISYGHQRISGRGRYLGGPAALCRSRYLPRLD